MELAWHKKDVEHALDRFYRADAVRNSKTGGTGLGLSIARWIIETPWLCPDCKQRGTGYRILQLFCRRIPKWGVEIGVFHDTLKIYDRGEQKGGNQE